MRVQLALLLVAAAFVAVAAGSTTGSERSRINILSSSGVASDANAGSTGSDDPVATNWRDFKHRHGRRYNTSSEEGERLKIFRKNYAAMKARQAQSGGEVFGVTQFMDMTEDEFRAKYLTFRPTERSEAELSAYEDDALPLWHKMGATGANVTSVINFDWRTRNAVGKVYNQGSCGSCWAWSAAGAIESAWFLKGNALTPLSAQQIVDCDSSNSGCSGGDPVRSYTNYLQKYGLQSQTQYAYTARKGTCKVSTTTATTTPKIKGYTWATKPCTSSTACNSQDENTMAINIHNVGPASVCVNAAGWQYYTGGVFTASCANSYYSLTHCVLAVGVGTTSTGQKYWILKNQWGSSWGESGYMRLAFGSNKCGVADEATFVRW